MKGVAYTSFALIFATAMVTVIIFPLQIDAYRSNEPQGDQRLELAYSSFERSSNKLLREEMTDHFKNYNSEIVNSSDFVTGNPRQEYDDSFQLVFDNFSQKVESSTNRFEYIDHFKTAKVGAVDIEDRIFLQFNKSFAGSVGSHSFNYSRSNVILRSPVEGKDPMLTLNSGKTFEYDLCESQPIESAEGDQGSGALLNGKVVVRPGNLSNIDDKESKILFVDGTEPYQISRLNEFRAVVVSSNAISGITTDYVSGLESGDLTLQEGDRVIIDDESVYRTEISNILESDNCYISDLPDNFSPTVYDRMANQTQNFGEDSLLTLINSSSQSSINETNYGFTEYTSADKQSVEVRGITFVDQGGIERPGFRLDPELLNYYNAGDLAS